MYFGLGAAAALSQGLRLGASGAYEMSRGGGNLWTGAINDIVASGTARLLYTEGTAAMA